MRFGVHWRIGADARQENFSLAYQLGTLLPDWFERHPIHTCHASLERLLNRLEQLRNMPPGPLKNWYLGTVAHYLTDYTCMAHDESEYYHFYRHRVYEVLSQKYEKKARAKRGTDCFSGNGRFLQQAQMKYPALFDNTVNSNTFRCEMRKLIIDTVSIRKQRIENLHLERWWTDIRIMEIDLRYAHHLIHTVLTIIHIQEKRNQNGRRSKRLL